MRLFANIPREEGSYYETFALVVFGKCYRKSYVVERHPDGTAIDHDRVPDGWYICLNIPYTKRMDYVSPITFENETGLCSAKSLIRIRKKYLAKYYSMTCRFAWAPLFPKVVAAYNDAYSVALDIKDKI